VVKSVKDGDKGQEVLAPSRDDDGALTKINLVPGKDADKVILQTPGQIKSEMGRIYRAKLKGRVSIDVADSLIRNNLLPMLRATEIEQEFNLAMDDPDDDTPALVGLTITGPGVALPEGAPARRLDGPDAKPTRHTKGTEDDQGQGKKEDNTADDKKPEGGTEKGPD